MHFETLKLTQDENNTGVFTITLDRQAALNALNTQMALDLIKALNFLEKSVEVKVLILTGAGKKSFCVGADLKERKNMSDNDWEKQHNIFEEAYLALRAFPLPTICAINGYALGGGLELALSCDFRLISETATVGLPEAKIGIIPGSGGTQLLPRIIDLGAAKELLFTGEHIEASRALSLRVVNHISKPDYLIKETNKKAYKISNNAPLSLKSIKKSVDTGIHTDLNTGISIEIAQYYRCAYSEDRREGVLAFNEKRSPRWVNK